MNISFTSCFSGDSHIYYPNCKCNFNFYVPEGIKLTTKNVLTVVNRFLPPKEKIKDKTPVTSSLTDQSLLSPLFLAEPK